MNIRVATKTDIPRIAEIHYTAFSPRTFFQAQYPDVEPDAFLDMQRERLELWMASPSGTFFVAQEEEQSEAGRILGYVWLRVVDPKGESERESCPIWQLVPYAPGTNVSCTKAYHDALDEWQKRLDKRPHYYLEILAVCPNAARKGVGKALVQQCIELARAAGQELYTDGIHEALPFWNKQRFQQVKGSEPIKLQSHIHAEVYLLMHDDKALRGDVRDMIQR